MGRSTCTRSILQNRTNSKYQQNQLQQWADRIILVAAGDIAQNYVPPRYRLDHPCDPFKQSMERLLVHRLCFCHPRLPATQGTNIVLFRRTPTRICQFLPTDHTLSCLLSTMSRQICRALRIWGLVTSRRKALLETQAACERNIPDTHKKSSKAACHT